jgi:SynChlorMet cassette protein ScmC
MLSSCEKLKLNEPFYLPFANGVCLRIRSGEDKVNFLVENLARICRMFTHPPYGTTHFFDCSIYSFDSLDYFKAENPSLIEGGRKHYFRFLSDIDFKNTMLFFNLDKMHNETMQILYTTNIAKVIQLKLLNSGQYAPCHCALVEINGKGAVICAKGDGGKTTSARRIEEAGHKAFADDFALLIKHKGEILCQAMPTWSNLLNGNLNYTADCSKSLPLTAVFFLKHGRTDYVEPVSKLEAVHQLNFALQDLFAGRTVTDMPGNMHQKLRLNIFDFAHSVLEKVPAYNLHATLHGNFWDKMDEVMRCSEVC